MVRQTSVQITEATGSQVDGLKARGFGSFTDIVRVAIDRMYMAECNPSQHERKAHEIGKWLVAESRRNPHLNEEHEFESREEARAHVRERNWNQCVYGPAGEFEMWDGHKWQ